MGGGGICVVQQEYEEFIVDGDINSSEVVLGSRARREDINIAPRHQNVMLYVHCLFCNLKFSSDFYYEQRFLSEQMRWRLFEEAGSFIKKLCL